MFKTYAMLNPMSRLFTVNLKILQIVRINNFDSLYSEAYLKEF